MLKIQFLFSCLFLLCVTTLSFGQGSTGQISGTVTDPNGAVVAGANVKAVNTATNFARETTSNGEGSFTIALLPAGSYSVEISSTGFSKFKATTSVNIAQATIVDAKLAVSGGEVTVIVDGPVTQIETSQNGRTITGDTIRQLPLPSRNFQQLLIFDGCGHAPQFEKAADFNKAVLAFLAK